MKRNCIKKKTLILWIIRLRRFIVLLPFTVIYRGWYEGDVISIALQILKYFLFSSTFPVSWYIMASIIGVCAITILSRYINNGILFIISLLAYAFCCAASNYGNLLTGGTGQNLCPVDIVVQLIRCSKNQDYFPSLITKLLRICLLYLK